LIRVYNKGKSTKNIISRFSGKAKEILLKQIDLFYNVDNQITKNRYTYISKNRGV